ncbi:hypothetical protein GQX73_g9995 [Xylaria multiplex]|uniref:Uncharacterized protein n=1 Tax=Xylaria multiplex TaxID=323545 RepID=A0A7C8IK44_9PEZI|nr:hypothetical protein GQX73_g9995 [Xylaria multiplex]
MDAFSAAVDASSILFSVDQLIKRATDKQKEQPALLETYGAEVNETKNIVELVQNQDQLQTAGTIATIQRVEKIGKALKEHLMHIIKDRSAVENFTHRLAQESADQRELASIMEQLTGAKQNLILQIQVANVGLMKKMNETLAINTELVTKMNNIVRGSLGQEHSLTIANFLAKLKSHPSGPDGSVQLTDAEYAALETEQIRVTDPEMANASSDVKQRITCKNMSRDQAQRILGPMQEDMWCEMAFTKIEGNVAADKSIQVSSPITMEAFDKLLAMRQNKA